VTEFELFESSDGVRIAYRTFGPPDARPPVVLHHGFAAHARANWFEPGIVAALTRAGRHGVAPDARGHGDSDKPHDPALYGEARMARDVAGLADHLGYESYDLVGYSMGAIVSALVAVADARVRRLVIGGVGAGLVEIGGVDTRVVPGGAIAAVLEADDASGFAPGISGFRALADAMGADRKALAAQARSVHSEPIDLARIAAPTLVLAGEKDPLAARPEVLAAALPAAELVRVPGDHLGAVAEPLFVASLVDFLSRD